MALPKKRFRAVLTNVKNTIADLSTFQALTSSANSTEAKTRIHDFAALDDGTQPLPRVVIDIDGHSGRKSGGGFRGPTFVLVMFELGIPDAYIASEATEAGWFWDQMDDWYDDMEDNVNGGGQLAVDDIDMTMVPGPLATEDIPAGHNNRHVWISQFRLEVAT